MMKVSKEGADAVSVRRLKINDVATAMIDNDPARERERVFWFARSFTCGSKVYKLQISSANNFVEFL